ncbi:PDZ domain, partial [Trinorchestia longiramus]
VTAGSIASQHLVEGDILVTLEGEDAKTLCHFDACDLVKHSGTRLSLTVRKASSIQYLHEENKVHQEKLEQIVVEEQKQQELERKFRRAMSTPPRDSNRSTPQRVVSPSNTISSPKPVQSPLSRVTSPPYSIVEPTGVRTPQNVFSPCRLLMSPSIKSQPTDNTSSKNILLDDKFKENEFPMSWVGAHSTSPAMRNVISPTQRSTPPTVVHASNLLPGVCSPPNILSPPLMSPRPNITSPPSLISPPPRHPNVKNASISSERVSASPSRQPQPVGDFSISSYSTPTLVLSPNQVRSPCNPMDADNGTCFPFPPREEQNFETDSAVREQQFSSHEEQNITADVQRRQLQLMIQEKLRLEEKMMIAKRKEGCRAEKMNKSKPVTTLTNEMKDVTNLPPHSHDPETSSNVQTRTASLDFKTDVSRHLVTNAVRTVRQEVFKATTSTQDKFVTQTDDIKSEIKLTKTTNDNPNTSVASKAVNPQDEANTMLDKLKKTARDKIAEFQKSFSLSRCVDETEQLREANRIRDEQIRKMQEHNLNQKQNKSAAKSAHSAHVGDDPKASDLRKVKTELKPGESDNISSVFPAQCFHPITDSLDGNTSTVMSTISKTEKKEVKSTKKDRNISEAEKAKLKEHKKKEDLKKIQEQFKKDQLLIHEEMKKKEAKAVQEKIKLDEIEAKQRTELQCRKDMEEKKLLAKLIYEEEQKLLSQKKQIEEKIVNEQKEREEEAQRAEVRDKIAREKEKFVKTIQVREKKVTENKHRQQSDSREPNSSSRTEKPVKKSIKESYENLKMKTYEQKRIEMQKAVQVQHVKSALQLNEALKRQSYTNLDDSNIYEEVNPARPTEEELDILKQEEEKQMLEEAKQYEEYRRHLESKHKNQVEDSDDYASEWDESSEASIRNYNNFQHEDVHDPEEPFDELKATSEEELLQAQEKSIRNLERQIRKQKEKDRRRNSLDSELVIDRSRTRRRNPATNQVPLRSQSERRAYSSTGDLRKSNSKTLPVTKFSPDPMEFGFKPIESPTFSKSMSNLDKGGSAESGAAVAGATAGAKATGLLVRPAPASGMTNADLLTKTHSLSASLGDLQQVS